MDSESIKIVSAADEAAVNGILTVAFATCPLLRWMYPEPEQYLRHFPGFIKNYCGDAYRLQSGAYYDNGLKGALLWLTSDAPRNDEDELVPFLRDSTTGHRRDEVLNMFEKFHHYHPTNPFWYFTVLGIDPLHQRKGLGGKLFRQALTLCDRAKAVAYGEATRESTARLYETLGFEVLDVVQFGSSPPFYPVRREPQQV
ncbi:GNAT family N-acetyltransferase [Chelativorans sp. YIM 93263]|uniref:GNAT family N-acetyltransferase n=1 Tax=Chelativorans sp. YIM 93263 TaxID=2906648 RepID=UPI002379DA89|nr:GNAT family N-acetyltransferase [Chelativorans sp. YIM 93263]